MIVWRLRPLPDFLSDHTLPGSTPAERLRDVVSRWVQLIGNLWSWQDRATFSIRFLAQNGVIDIFLIASARKSEDETGLRSETEVLLRAHRLCLNDALNAKSLARCIEAWNFDGDAILEVRQTRFEHFGNHVQICSALTSFVSSSIGYRIMSSTNLVSSIRGLLQEAHLRSRWKVLFRNRSPSH